MTLNDKNNKNLQSESILSNTLSGIKLCKIFRNKNAVYFTKKLIENHYKKFFSNSSREIKAIDEAFEILTNGQIDKTSIVNLKKSIDYISKHVYSHDNIPKFFTKYQTYKSSLKPEYYFLKIENDILGKKILDFGTGKGHMSQYLQNKGFETTSTDVIDYRESNKKNIPFVKINYTDEISKKISRKDTSLLITVLHHISEEYIIDTLKELSKISKRLIIIEDIQDPLYLSKQEKTKSIEQFLKLSKKEQEDSVKIMDFYGNIVTQGLVKMNLPFQFKSIDEWKDILHKSGFSIKNVQFLDLPETSFHGFFQVKIVCDSLKI